MEESRQRGESGKSGGRALAVAALVFWVTLAYANSFSGAFLFDDECNILTNPAVRCPRISLLADPAYTAALNTRPLVTLSLAANHAIGGFAPFSYHLVNLGIHLAASLFLFFSLGLLFRSPGFSERFSRHGTFLSFLITLVWAVHPLQTESVTYVIQRCESLMGMFFLAAVFFSLKGWRSPRRHWWHVLAILCLFLGEASKEVMAACPAIVLAMDVVANQKSPWRAVKESWVLYAGFALGLAAMAWWLSPSVKGVVAGRSRNYSRLEYLSTQPAVILHYLGQAFWPASLRLDYYGWPVSSPAAAAWTSLPIAAALAFTLYALWRKRPAGLAGAWFFLILAPSSSVMALNNMAAEHRMYLPLAAVAALLVCGGYRLLDQLSARLPGNRRRLALGLGVLLCLACAAALSARTMLRNRDYASEAGMWRSVVEEYPGQARARANLCSALVKEGKKDEALVQCREALRLRPGYHTALVNIGAIQIGRGQYREALENFRAALESDPGNAMAANNIGATLLYLNRPQQAAAFFRKALELQPFYAMAAGNLAYSHLLAGQDAEAAKAAGAALSRDPDNQRALTVMGVLSVKAGDLQAGKGYLARALALDPQDATARSYLEYIRARSGG